MDGFRGPFVGLLSPFSLCLCGCALANASAAELSVRAVEWFVMLISLVTYLLLNRSMHLLHSIPVY